LIQFGWFNKKCLEKFLPAKIPFYEFKKLKYKLRVIYFSIWLLRGASRRKIDLGKLNQPLYSNYSFLLFKYFSFNKKLKKPTKFVPSLVS